MIELKRDSGHSGIERWWRLYGPHGVVSLDTWTSTSAYAPVVSSVSWHSPRPQYSGHEPEPGCRVLEGDCYVEAGAGVAVSLLARWASAGQDDEVIWNGLGEFYADLPGGKR